MQKKKGMFFSQLNLDSDPLRLRLVKPACMLFMFSSFRAHLEPSNFEGSLQENSSSFSCMSTTLFRFQGLLWNKSMNLAMAT